MTRPLRIEISGALYIVSAQGNNNSPIFSDDQDKHLFLSILESVVEKYHWKCHAYCLMDSSYRLVIETPEANLSRGMRQLGGMYTQRYNTRHSLTGHLFQGRFSSIIVEKDLFFTKACREVMLAPVRRQIVNHPRAWHWSSYIDLLGIRQPPAFLSTDIIAAFGENPVTARHAFTAFVMAGLDEPPLWESITAGVMLGSSEFIERTNLLLQSRNPGVDMPRAQRFAVRPELSSLFEGVEDKAQRNRSMARAHIEHGYTLKEIGDHLGIHYSTVSKALSQISGIAWPTSGSS